MTNASMHISVLASPTTKSIRWAPLSWQQIIEVVHRNGKFIRATNVYLFLYRLKATSETSFFNHSFHYLWLKLYTKQYTLFSFYCHFSICLAGSFQKCQYILPECRTLPPVPVAPTLPPGPSPTLPPAPVPICQNNQVWRICVSGCEGDCQFMRNSYSCAANECESMCGCPKGLKNNGTHCVPPSSCDCFDKDSEIQQVCSRVN